MIVYLLKTITIISILFYLFISIRAMIIGLIHQDATLLDRGLKIFAFAFSIIISSIAILLFISPPISHQFSLDFVDEYPELKDLFIKYIEEDKQFTTLFCKIIRKFAKLKEFSINSKIVKGIIYKLKSDWNSYWALFDLAKNKQYDKPINIPKYKKQYNLVEYGNQVLSKKKLKLGFIGSDKMKQGFKLSKKQKDLNCKCFRIFHKNNNFVCELIYEKEIKDQTVSTGKVASIDLGLKNYLHCFLEQRKIK